MNDVSRLTLLWFESVQTIEAGVSIFIRLSRAIHLTYYFDHHGDIMITNSLDDRDYFDHVITSDSVDVSKASSQRLIDPEHQHVARIRSSVWNTGFTYCDHSRRNEKVILVSLHCQDFYFRRENSWVPLNESENAENEAVRRWQYLTGIEQYPMLMITAAVSFWPTRPSWCCKLDTADRWRGHHHDQPSMLDDGIAGRWHDVLEHWPSVEQGSFRQVLSVAWSTAAPAGTPAVRFVLDENESRLSHKSWHKRSLEQTPLLQPIVVPWSMTVSRNWNYNRYRKHLDWCHHGMWRPGKSKWTD